MARAKWQGIHWEPLSPCCFLIAEPSEQHVLQQGEIGSTLANLLRHQRRQHIDIVLVSEACACIDLQTGETVILGEADL